MEPYWDLTTLLFYIALASVGYVSFRQAKAAERHSSTPLKLSTRPYMIWALIWVMAASFRYVAEGVGGADAIEYIRYFDVCLDENMPVKYYHYDIAYRIFTQAVRIFTDNYHVFFLVFYTILILSYFLFLKEFCPPDISFAPFILIFFLYLRGFTTLRTNFSVAVLLVALVLLKRERFKSAFIMMILCVLIHKASIIYVLIYPFYLFYRKRKLTVKAGILLTACMAAAGGILRWLMMGRLGQILGDAYSSYASRSLSASFFDGFWKIAFEQMFLALTMIILHRKIKSDIQFGSPARREQLKMIWIFSIYDFMMIPITYILSVWRGYEYLYLIRLIMWGEIIKLVKGLFTSSSRRSIELLCLAAFILWLVFRIASTWSSS